jgi:inosine/xanthosine triphosphatase
MAVAAPESACARTAARTCVAVGSTNPVKLSSVKRAFERFFPDTEIVTISYAASSGVSDQPMTDEETLRGALNRCQAVAAACKDALPDYAVGLEGGCSERSVALPGTEVKYLECFAWMAVFQVCSGRFGWARTGSFQLPPAVAELVISGVELGIADDRVFGRSNSKQQDGAVGLLTRGVITRTDYYEHALLLALVPFGLSEHFTEQVPVVPV